MSEPTNQVELSAEMPALPFTEEDVQRGLRRALLWVTLAALAAGPVLSFWQGWQSWILFVVGAAISAAGTFEWMRLLSAIMARMDQGRAPRPMFRVLATFFLRLAAAGLLLYASLYSLHGSIYALLAGLGTSLLAVSAESFRLMARRGTAHPDPAGVLGNPEQTTF